MKKLTDTGYMVVRKANETFDKFKSKRDKFIKEKGLEKGAEAFGWKNPEKKYPTTPIISRVAKRVGQKIGEGYKYYKAGKKATKEEYNKLQRIKGTPENFRSQEDIDYAEEKNKTLRIKSKKPKAGE